MWEKASTYRVIHLEVEQVEGASFALEQVLGLLDDGRDQPLETHLFLKQTPGKGKKQLQREQSVVVKDFRNGGSHHSSVDQSAPTILQFLGSIPKLNIYAFQIIFEL